MEITPTSSISSLKNVHSRAGYSLSLNERALDQVSLSSEAIQEIEKKTHWIDSLRQMHEQCPPQFERGGEEGHLLQTLSLRLTEEVLPFLRETPAWS